MSDALEFVAVSYAPPAGDGGGRFAIERLDLVVARGEWLALLGPSGSGKTTLLRLALRLVDPASGTIRLGGLDAAQLDPVAWRRRLGYVPQAGGLFPNLCVRDNVGVVAAARGDDRRARVARSEELLDRVRLPAREFGDRWPQTLSGGQRQRVAIARALQLDPEVLLFDEPFGALDPVTRSELRRELRALPALQERTAVLVTHDLDEAFELADRIALLDAGRLVQVGTAADLRERPASPWVARFLAGGDA